ncbi:MAG TPA: response regulator, partial [Chthoniobacterales bacterium]|nr:response regulator [Chthoniobacterales bacterium]
MPGIQVLVLEPDEKVAAEIISALGEAAPGTVVVAAASLGEAQQLVLDQKPALFVLDVDATYDLAQEFIYDLRTSHPDARAIILTAIHFSAEREQVAGLGAIHFLEKPFPRADFMALVEALLVADENSGGERFQGTLSDLHIADIIQLKCISGATSMLEFTGPRGEKARVYFENGQVRHATAPGKEGLAAFNQIVDWKGGVISEVPVPHGTPHTINLEWQVLLMEAVRTIDESRSTEAQTAAPSLPNESPKTILVIDDSPMLLSFVKEILDEQNYKVLTAPAAAEGLDLSRSVLPDLILLDFILPDMKGDEVCRKLIAHPATAGIPVVYVSGFGSDLQPDRAEVPNVVGSLAKPFTSDTLIKAVRGYLAGE